MHEAKEIKLNKSLKEKDNKRYLIKQAKRAGASLARRGGNLISDEELERRYNFNLKLIDFFKRSYWSHYTSPKEQGIRKAISAAKECLWKGRKLPSDESLQKKYTPDEVIAYKETFSSCYKTEEEQERRKKQCLDAKSKYYAKKEKNLEEKNHSMQKESHKEFFIRTFLARLEQKTQESAKIHEENYNHNNEYDTYIADFSNHQEITGPIPSPFDILKKKSGSECSRPLLFKYPFDTFNTPYTETEHQQDIEDLNRLYYGLIQ